MSYVTKEKLKLVLIKAQPSDDIVNLNQLLSTTAELTASLIRKVIFCFQF